MIREGLGLLFMLQNVILAQSFALKSSVRAPSRNFVMGPTLFGSQQVNINSHELCVVCLLTRETALVKFIFGFAHLALC